MSAVPAMRQSRARSTPAARNAGVIAAAGTDGHVLTPAQLPAPRTMRLDLVDPVIAFVAYGIPMPATPIDDVVSSMLDVTTTTE